MKAITFQGVSDVRAETVADPKIVDATDIVVRITTSAVCGSDLHQYHGRGGGALVQKGAIMGHEFMGVVEEAGAAVRTVRAGDRVVLPFNVSCGACEWCRRKLPSQCATTGRAVFGGRFGHVWGGGQAERVRVPFADHLCEKVDASLSDDEAAGGHRAHRHRDEARVRRRRPPPPSPCRRDRQEGGDTGVARARARLRPLSVRDPSCPDRHAEQDARLVRSVCYSISRQ